MSDLSTRKPVPPSRIIFYGFFAMTAVTALAYFQHDPQFYIFAPIAGVFVMGFGFFASWMRTKAKIPAWFRWLVFIGLLASAVEKLVAIIHSK